jgi:Flp pilus assembly protein TadG
MTTKSSLSRRALSDQHGQVLPWVAFMLVLFLGMSAFVLDVGHAFYCKRELQAATDAAALAGAQSLKNSSPTAVVAAFSAENSGQNTYGNLPNVSITPGWPKYACLSSVTKAACVATKDASGNSITANAIQVQEQVNVPTFFARVFGISQLAISATSTAAIVGAKNQIANLAIVLDTTASMQTVDSNCSSSGGSAERVVCAEQGVQVLLQDMSPCNTALGCGTVTNGIATNALDQVAIFTFPNVTVGSAQDDYNCSGSNPSIPAYSLPTIGTSAYPPNASGTASSTATYQVTPFLSDYRSSDNASALDTGSNLSMATGAGVNSSGKSCSGMQAPGGDGTYYAGVIYAAQAALTAQAANEVAANPSANAPQNVMIILTDGEANASKSKMASSEANGTALATSSNWPAGGGATSSITNYPSAFDQCQQAVAAANYAKGQGTQIYTIAYGSESSGCTTDSTGPQPNITPCQVMSEMASTNTGNTVYFYSDYKQSGSASTCISPGSPLTDLSSIFGQIVVNFLNVKLIPESAWPSS